MGARHLDIIDDPARARVALQPIRLRLLHLLEQPQSAPRAWVARQVPEAGAEERVVAGSGRAWTATRKAERTATMENHAPKIRAGVLETVEDLAGDAATL